MLDRKKLLEQLNNVSQNIFAQFAKEQDIAKKVWDSIQHDASLEKKMHEKNYSLLIPYWKGALGCSIKIDAYAKNYTTLAVDGSQIYYDKHQGPTCYMINVGSALLEYKKPKSAVELVSQPHVFIGAYKGDDLSTEAINMKREEYELQEVVEKSLSYKQNSQNSSEFITFFDGSLIFFQLDGGNVEEKQRYLQSYLASLEKLSEEQILHVGYMSFPRTKELVNILKLVLVQFDEKALRNSEVLDQLNDMDIAQFFLQPGERSIIFQSRAPIGYLYPEKLKTYFCYFHVGFEIVRLEFPQWIAESEDLVNNLCSLAFDQVAKGKGYPVCLFEAHEQAVIKNMDREFFYRMIQRMSQKSGYVYGASHKSLKKRQMPL